MCTAPNTNLRGFNQALQILLKTPSHFLPHLTIPTFTHLPEQLGPHLVQNDTTQATTAAAAAAEKTKRKVPNIRALVLDKDNTLCYPKTTIFPPAIIQKLSELRTSPTSPFNTTTNTSNKSTSNERNISSILIVSNRAGSHPNYDHEIHALEDQLTKHNLSIPIFRLPQGVEKKPFCGDAVVDWFRERGVIERADEIAVVGDRLGTDGIMARMMGSWSVWCRDGVFEGEEYARSQRNVLERMEMWMERYLRVGRGLRAPSPKGWDA